MHDLCSRPEQPEPMLTPTDMGSRRGGEAVQHLQQEPKKFEDGMLRGISGGGVTIMAKNTSSLGKRYHSLYANLNGFEVQEKQKVSVKSLVSGRMSLYVLQVN